MARRAKPAKVKVEAKPPVGRKAPESEGSQVREIEKRLAEALKQRAEASEQQTAISEILRVISSSPGDVKPMLNAVSERALKLCDAADSTILLVEGDRLRAAARFGGTPGAVGKGKFMPLTRGSVTGRAIASSGP